MRKLARQYAWAAWWLAVLGCVAAGRLVRPDGLAIPQIHGALTGNVLFGCWGISFVLMTVAMFCLRRERLAFLVVAQCLGGALIASIPVMPSVDSYMYVGFGDMLLRGEDPWHPPHLPMRNSIAVAETRSFGNPPDASRYGPAFVALQALLLRVLPEASLSQLIYAERAISLLCALAISILIRGPNIRFWALNPFVLYNFGLEAHNDVIFLFLIAVGMRTRHWVLKGILVGFAGMTKIVAFGSLFFGRRRLDVTVVAIMTALLLTLLVPHAIRGSFSGLVDQTTLYNGSGSMILHGAFVHFRLGKRSAAVLTSTIVGLLVALLCAAIRWNRRDMPAVASAIFVLALPKVLPWYFGWSLFSAVTSAHRTTRNTVVGICLASFLLEYRVFGPPRHYYAISLVFLVATILISIRMGWATENLRAPFSKESTIGGLYRRIRTTLQSGGDRAIPSNH